MRIRFGMVILLLGVWLSGCATLNPGPRRENFAPLFVYSEDEKREGRALDALGPFFTYRKDSEEKEVAFRPFFYSTREPGRYRLDYLYPMGGYERTEQRVHSYFHFVYSTDRESIGLKKEVDRFFSWARKRVPELLNCNGLPQAIDIF